MNQHGPHPMWKRGTCNSGHKLTPRSYRARHCLDCKTEKTLGLRKSDHPSIQFAFNPPVVNDPSWHLRAICYGDDTEVYFQTHYRKLAPARQVCGRCPLAVRRDCLVAGLRDEHGYRGGATARDREEIRQGRMSFEQTLGVDGEPTVSVPLAQEGVA